VHAQPAAETCNLKLETRNLKAYGHRMKPIQFIKCLVVLSLAVVAVSLCGTPGTAQQNENRSGVTVGKKAPSFEAKTVDGKTIKFPDDYKGKVVLLDFWATWCGPCVHEMPNVVSAYQHYHSNGFEIVSVSLDRPKQQENVMQFTKSHSMTWAQIYDGGYWKTPIAVQYGVQAIPCPIIVDGDTGNVLAEGDGAVGSRLIQVIKPALAAKAKK